MIPALHDSAALHDDNLIGVAHGGKAVADHNGHFVGRIVLKMGKDIRFGLGVHGGGRFVEHQESY